MTTFRVLVVDDEPLAREAAVNLLRRDPDVEPVTECEDGLRAKQVIADAQPDIVFLDIEMPGLNGLQLAVDLTRGPSVIVFMTAFSQYAVDAFDLAAIDYVLKPFSDERFLEALGRAKRRLRERQLGELAQQVARVAGELQPGDGEPAPSEGPRYLQRLSIKQGDRTLVLRIDEIIWIEAQDYCVMIHSTRGSHLVRASLASLATRLPPETFVRTHRTAIVNLQHVSETDERDGLRLVMSDKSQVGVSRSRKNAVESLLSPRLR